MKSNWKNVNYMLFVISGISRMSLPGNNFDLPSARCASCLTRKANKARNDGSRSMSRTRSWAQCVMIMHQHGSNSDSPERRETVTGQKRERERETDKEKLAGIAPRRNALRWSDRFNKHIAKLYDYESSRKRRKAPGAPRWSLFPIGSTADRRGLS